MLSVMGNKKHRSNFRSLTDLLKLIQLIYLIYNQIISGNVYILGNFP